MSRAKKQQLKLFPSQVEAPLDDPQVARVLLNKVRLERTRQFGCCWLGLQLWKRLELDRFFEEAVEELGGRRAVVARGGGAGDQPAVCAEQRVGDRRALVSLDGAGRFAGYRRRQAQRHAAVPLPGPDSAAQDKAGTASPAALRRAVRGGVRRAAV